MYIKFNHDSFGWYPPLFLMYVVVKYIVNTHPYPNEYLII